MPSTTPGSAKDPKTSDLDHVPTALCTALALNEATTLDTAIAMAAKVHGWLDQEARTSQRLRDEVRSLKDELPRKKLTGTAAAAFDAADIEPLTGEVC